MWSQRSLNNKTLFNVRFWEMAADNVGWVLLLHPLSSLSSLIMLLSRPLAQLSLAFPRRDRTIFLPSSLSCNPPPTPRASPDPLLPQPHLILGLYDFFPSPFPVPSPGIKNHKSKFHLHSWEILNDFNDWHHNVVFQFTVTPQNTAHSMTSIHITYVRKEKVLCGAVRGIW